MHESAKEHKGPNGFLQLKKGSNSEFTFVSRNGRVYRLCAKLFKGLFREDIYDKFGIGEISRQKEACKLFKDELDVSSEYTAVERPAERLSADYLRKCIDESIKRKAVAASYGKKGAYNKENLDKDVVLQESFRLSTGCTWGDLNIFEKRIASDMCEKLSHAAAVSGKQVETYLTQMQPVIKKAMQDDEYFKAFMDVTQKAQFELQDFIEETQKNTLSSDAELRYMYDKYLSVAKKFIDLADGLNPKLDIETMSVAAAVNLVDLCSNLKMEIPKISREMQKPYSNFRQIVNVSKHNSERLSSQASDASATATEDFNFARQQLLDLGLLRNIEAQIKYRTGSAGNAQGNELLPQMTHTEKEFTDAQCARLSPFFAQSMDRTLAKDAQNPSDI